MTEKELEKLFKDKLNNRKFAFNPDNFARVEKLLAAHKVVWYQTVVIKIAAVAVAASLLVTAGIWQAQFNRTSLPRYSNQPFEAPAVAPPVANHTPPAFFELLQNMQHPKLLPVSSPLDFKKFNGANNQLQKASQNRNTTIANGGATAADPAVNMLYPKQSFAGNAAVSLTEVAQLIPNDNPSESPLAAAENIVAASEAPAPEIIPLPLTPKHARRLHHQFYVHAGFNVADGLQGNTSTAEKAAASFVAGATYRYLHNLYWEFQAGLSYNNRGALNNVRITEAKLYGFGAEVLETHYHAKRLAFVEAPIAIRWFPQSKHTIVTGMYAAYLLGTQTEVHYVQNFAADQQTAIQMERGHTTGIARWDGGLVLGYDYQISDKLNAGFQSLTGFQDLFADADFKQSGFNNGTQIRFLVYYRFW